MSDRPQRIRPGLYEYRGKAILRTELDAGPRGGRKYRLRSEE